jgi:phosphatidylethanolamine/phosphatidyl-N-methylethanolamine N-methyltransferase
MELLSDAALFVRTWAAKPLKVASVWPSGAALSQLITRQIDAGTGPVLELGPGTGVFTRALLARGVSEADLTLVESEPRFALLLRVRHPLARVLTVDAASASLPRRFDNEEFGAVVSGLPLLSMRPKAVMGVLHAGFARLKPGGAFYQFTYGWRCPVRESMLRRLGLEAQRIGFALRNLPPATVYRIARR